jgi:hypothetical protein
MDRRPNYLLRRARFLLSPLWLVTNSRKHHLENTLAICVRASATILAWPTKLFGSDREMQLPLLPRDLQRRSAHQPRFHDLREGACTCLSLSPSVPMIADSVSPPPPQVPSL